MYVYVTGCVPSWHCAHVLCTVPALLGHGAVQCTMTLLALLSHCTVQCTAYIAGSARSQYCTMYCNAASSAQSLPSTVGNDAMQCT